MKKMLFIGAMLIVGMTTFASRGVVIGDSPKQETQMSGGTNLGIVANGEVVDAANEVLLVVTPTVSNSNDDASILFSFGDVKSGEGKSVDGEFTVQVLNQGVAVNMGTSLHVNLRETGEAVGDTKKKEIKDRDLIRTNGSSNVDDDKLGTLSYTLTDVMENDGRLYTGKIVSNVVIGKGKTGAFSDSACFVDVQLKALVP